MSFTIKFDKIKNPADQTNWVSLSKREKERELKKVITQINRGENKLSELKERILGQQYILSNARRRILSEISKLRNSNEISNDNR